MQCCATATLLSITLLCRSAPNARAAAHLQRQNTPKELRTPHIRATGQMHLKQNRHDAMMSHLSSHRQLSLVRQDKKKKERDFRTTHMSSLQRPVLLPPLHWVNVQHAEPQRSIPILVSSYCLSVCAVCYDACNGTCYLFSALQRS